MAVPLAVPAALAVGSQILGGLGVNSAAKASRRQINRGMDENVAMSEAQRQEQLALQQPWMQAGQQALGDYGSFRMRQPEPYQANTFGGVNMAEDPGVQYRLNAGRQALDASAANAGNLFSGAQQKALMKYGQELGSQEFGNAYNRQYGQFKDAETARRDQYNLGANRNMSLDQYRMGQLQNIANMGQNATNASANAVGRIGQNQLQQQMLLRGAKADINAVNDANPWNVAGNIANAGSAYFMNR